ncbi:hypothetical protein VTJ04DRAFT_68 [Mycothermus thermophilus]|uniref:uncharacterized protein n=1 Tax=Humicola insolens TaxID=85995 RepID=UPI0037443FE2
MLTLSTALPLLGLLVAHLSTPAQAQKGKGKGKGKGKDDTITKPIMLRQSGGFTIGGKVITHPTNPSMTQHCDHGYVEYFTPWTPRKTGIFMWHSSSTQTFQNRWDGGEGFKDKFLRRDYPVFLWDGPRVGRANWACEPTEYAPDYRDQINFWAWNFGPEYPNWWSDVQFPTDDTEAWRVATSARYVEYDTIFNVHLETDTAAVAVDSGKLGDSIVILGNSASGLRAQLTAVKSNSSRIKGIVAYEGYGCVFPDNAGVEPGDAFGPFVVPLEDFKKLAKIPIQFLWGDHRDESFEYLNMSRQAAEWINRYGGNAQVIKLGEDLGMKGTTHIPFADMDNEEVAVLLEDFLKENNLDKYA